MCEKRFQGKGVYGAFAIGKVLLFGKRDITVKRTHVENAQDELKRLEEAKKLSAAQLEEIYQKVLLVTGDEDAQIFEIHMMLLEDEDYNKALRSIIEEQLVNAEYAVAAVSDDFARIFASMDDEYMQARAADIRDISNRIIGNLTGAPQNTAMTVSDKVIICADDLTPSETVLFDKEKVLAFVTAHGTLNSHTAILARNMNIPAIIGAGDEFLSSLKDGMTAIADGYSGEIIINPGKDTYDEYLKKQKADEEEKSLLQNLRGKENITVDGTKINIYANIGSVDSIASVIAGDAGGIGLFRSEFLYLEKTDYPDEEEQFLAYKKVLESMEGKKVIIRTLDIGADKQAEYFHLNKGHL